MNILEKIYQRLLIAIIGRRTVIANFTLHGQAHIPSKAQVIVINVELQP